MAYTSRDEIAQAVREVSKGVKDGIIKERLKIEEKYPGKDASESKKMKEGGNKAYQEGKDLQALTCYTQVRGASSEILKITFTKNSLFSGHNICSS